MMALKKLKAANCKVSIMMNEAIFSDKDLSPLVSA